MGIEDQKAIYMTEMDMTEMDSSLFVSYHNYYTWSI